MRPSCSPAFRSLPVSPKFACPISTFYYWPDVRFMLSFNESIKRLEAGAA